MNLKFKILLSILFFPSLTSFAQTQKNDYGYDSLDSVISSKTALRDIELNKVKIFGQGGIAPVAYTKTDSIFEATYKVKYILFGCVSPYEHDAMRVYNEEVGRYLDKKHGTAWRKDLHPDVIALK